MAAKSNRKSRRLTARAAMLEVVGRLHEHGYQALLAGGCVRDMLLGREPDDYDIATNATPDTVVELFPRSLTVGAQFGVVVVLLGGRQVEVATFRSDADYSDGRRPDKVVFSDAQHDAERRDFTINGMFYDPLAEEVVDYVGGKADLEGRLVRAIGCPEDRIAEDHLRMLRAIRFTCRLDFTLDAETQAAVCRHAEKITRVSAERIAVELEKMLSHPSRNRAIAMLRDTGLLAAIMPHMTQAELTAGAAIVEKLPAEASFPLALAALLGSGSIQQAKRVCGDLKSSNDVRDEVVYLFEKPAVLLTALPLSRGRLKRWLAQRCFLHLLDLVTARRSAEGLDDGPVADIRRQIADLGDEPIEPTPFIDGNDLIARGVQPGRRLGELLDELYLAQLENELASREQALQRLEKLLDSGTQT